MTIMQMNIYGSLLIIFTVIIRSVAMNKLPKKTFIALWLIIISRLLIPYTIPPLINIYPVMDTLKLSEISGEILYKQTLFFPQVRRQPQDEFTPPDISNTFDLTQNDIIENNTETPAVVPVTEIKKNIVTYNYMVYMARRYIYILRVVYNSAYYILTKIQSRIAV